MPSCAENITALGICPDEGPSLSRFLLTDAPGISIRTLADSANETYTQGTTMAMAKKKLSLTQVTNDFIGALQANKVVTTISKPVYDSAQFNTGVLLPGSALERGTILHKAKWKGNIRTTYIKAIQVYPNSSGDGDLIIYDGYNRYSYPVSLIGGQINIFDATTLDDFPFAVNSNSREVKIYLNTAVQVYSAPIICHTGCRGTKNDCAWASGWDGVNYQSKEGHGINVQFYCDCDYDKILCDLAKSYSGELIWLKWQINILQEMKDTNRFTNWVIYNQDSVGDRIAELKSDYQTKWNQLMDGLFGILSVYKDDCLNCRARKWVVNM